MITASWRGTRVSRDVGKSRLHALAMGKLPSCMEGTIYPW